MYEIKMETPRAIELAQEKMLCHIISPNDRHAITLSFPIDFSRLQEAFDGAIDDLDQVVA